MMAASRLCGCGARIPGGAAPRRCARCTRQQQRAKDAKRPQRRSRQVIASNAALVAEHRLRFGDWCPGVPELGRPAHPAADLTADHLLPVAAGGDEHGPRIVRCRSCNSARGANRTKGIAG